MKCQPASFFEIFVPVDGPAAYLVIFEAVKANNVFARVNSDDPPGPLRFDDLFGCNVVHVFPLPVVVSVAILEKQSPCHYQLNWLMN